jgi:aminoglycoside-2''-adenylyltransferase
VDEQLSALARVSGMLDTAGIDHWLFGGWAVDFYAGEVTRPHDDVDLAVWLEDFPRIAELLHADGWRHAPYEDEDGGTGYERGAVRMEFTFLVRDGARIVMPMKHGSVEWPEEALSDDVAELHGVCARILALATLRQWKSSPRDDADDATKDRADFERLSRLGT